jgi:hypothetical protein
MKKEDYLKKNDIVKVAQNHPQHPNRKGRFLSMYARSPAGTKEIYDYVRLGDMNTGEWFTVRFENAVKLEDGKPIPFVEDVKEDKKKNKKKTRKRKKEYPDRIIEWGQWIRYDLKNDTTVIRPHNTVDERYSNTDFEAKLAKEKTLKKRWAKHIGWAVKPKYGDINSLVFVGSVEQAEDYPFPFQPKFIPDEDSSDEIYFEPAF